LQVPAAPGTVALKAGQMQKTFLEQHDSGWVTFAAVMFLFVGMFNLIAGIAALADDSYFQGDELLFANLSFWGWTWIVGGALQLMTSYLVFKGSTKGFVLGVLLAGLNALDHLLGVGAYPIWSIIVITIDFIIIWALVAATDRASAADDLGKLSELRRQGAISPDEYERAKARII
jgi:putative oligomerization/nucleic acid binding protein